jgi:hypothetical protein
MKYVVKVFDTRGTMYRTQIPYDALEDARAQYNSEHLYGRFMRAELWSGSFTNETWTDSEMLASKVKS